MIPIGYDPSPLLPNLYIKDLDGTILYAYETLSNEPLVKNIELAGGSLSAGINTDQGTFTFVLRDDFNNLLDLSNPIQSCKVKAGMEVLLNLGKNQNNIQTWFRGIVTDTQKSSQTKTTSWEIVCFGWASLVSSRYSSLTRTQQKLANGITPDPADTTTHISELFKDVIRDTDHLAVPGLGLLDITLGEIEDIPISLSEYRKNFVTIGSELNELAQMGNCYWGVTPDKQLFLKKRNSRSSGFLITNDLENPGVITANWNRDKLVILRDQLIVRDDTSKDTAFTILHGIGSQRKEIDHSNLLSNAILDISIQDIALPFTPIKDNISQVSIHIEKFSPLEINQDLIVSIIGSLETGFPNVEDIRETKIIPAFLLQKLFTDSNSRYIDILYDKIPTTTDEKLFVLINLWDINKTPGIFPAINYQTGTGQYFTRAVDGSWVPNVGDAKLITYQSKTTRIVGQNTTTRRSLRPKEGIVTLPDGPDETTVKNVFESILDVKSKIVSNYSPVHVSPPTNPPIPGETIRLIEKSTQFDKEISLIGFSLTFNAYDGSALGAYEISLLLQDLF